MMGRVEPEGWWGGGVNCGLLGGIGGEAGEADWGQAKVFIFTEVILYYFQVYNLKIQYLHLLQNDHNKCSEHLSLHIVTHFLSHKKFIVTKALLIRTSKTYSLSSFQICTAY